MRFLLCVGLGVSLVATMAMGQVSLDTEFVNPSSCGESRQTLDQHLLNSIGTVCGTVSAITVHRDKENRPFVALSLENTLVGYWNYEIPPTSEFLLPLPGEPLFEADEVVALDIEHEDYIEEGQRLCIAITDDLEAQVPHLEWLFRVDEEGFLSCHGGMIFGLAETGVICSTAERVYGASWQEFEFLEGLNVRWERARRRAGNTDLELGSWSWRNH